MELLRESAKRCGFKDMAIITCGDLSINRKNADIDGVYAYGWGHYGYDLLTGLAESKVRLIQTFSTLFQQFRSDIMMLPDVRADIL